MLVIMMGIRSWLERHSTVNYWFPVYVYVIFIFYLSSRPGPSFEVLIVRDMMRFDPENVILHIFEYSGLGYLLYRGLVNSDKKVFYEHAFLLAVLFGLFYGITDEVHQYFVPLRGMRFWDMISDGVGSTVGAIVSFKDNKKG